MSTSLLIAATFVCLPVQQAVELESPTAQEGQRVAAAPAQDLEQRVLYAYDVTDIVTESAKRTSFEFGEGKPEELDEEESRDAALEALLSFVHDFIQPKLDPQLDDIKIAGTTLVANIRPVHDEWMRSFLEAQRNTDSLIDIQARIFDAPKGTFTTKFERPSKVLSGPEELNPFLEELHNTAGIQAIQSPRVLVFPRQRAHIAVLDQIAYIKEYELEIVQPGDVLIADPVIDVVQDGFVIEIQAAETRIDECGLDIEIHYSKTKQPIATKEVKLNEFAEPVTVGTPEVMSISVKTKAVLAQGAAIAFRAPDPTGERDFVVMVRATLVRGERLEDMLDVPSGTPVEGGERVENMLDIPSGTPVEGGERRRN